MEILPVPEERKGIKNRGISTSTTLWMEEKAEADSRLWKTESQNPIAAAVENCEKTRQVVYKRSSQTSE